MRRYFFMKIYPPEDWKANNAKSRAVSGHLPSNITADGGMHRNTIE